VKSIARKIEAKVGWTDSRIAWPQGGRVNPLSVGWKDEAAAKQAVAAGFPNMEPWTRLFEVREDRNWGNAGTHKGWSVRRKNGGRIGELHDTKEAAIEAAKAEYAKLGAERKTGGEEPKRPHLDQIERSGPDYRKGRDVAGEDFVKDFGFRGVEFGNWVASDERQKSVNFAYDALHDLARVLNVPPKALSLDGTLAVAFGARGRGGKAAAHYEPGRRVINLTKLSGAGTLAHEYGHALDHYLGWVSGEDKQPSVGSFAQGKFEIKNKHLPLKLRTAINRLMHDFHEVEEDDAAAEARLRRHIESAKHGQAGWQEHLRKLRERKAKGGSAAGVTQAETQVEVWGRKIKMLESELESGRKKSVPSKYLTNASELSGKTGDYWKRPTELFARAFEAYAYDKIEADGFQSQYLVQGVEPNRFGNGFRGVVIANPPFGAVKENGESKVFDLSDIQPGYQTNEIDHAIALRSLEGHEGRWPGGLILGGLNKQVTSREGRSDAYNGKAKREFYKTLYDRYNVTDHFTVNGDLYERQGAGWPVDVIVINGRGQVGTGPCPRSMCPVSMTHGRALGGLLDGIQSNAGNAARAGGSRMLRPAEAPIRSGRIRQSRSSGRSRSEQSVGQPEHKSRRSSWANSVFQDESGDRWRKACWSGEWTRRAWGTARWIW
jgi:hypothetical protein